ncbi:MAG: YHS domain-containing protein [Spirochaetaceae bacterium]|nr:YHS domain-containing protein [Myxococcales bacterium]MCB9724227.1 YHS domain-containing protein [Spirochaetaceae bacterium]HPG24143.1 YHS domain-containing (seleno)protein [Myxococcota bacterium]
MYRLPTLSAFLVVLATATFSALAASAADPSHSTPGVQGYDLVSYHVDGEPTRGNGHHVSVHDGVTYLFANEGNRKAFERDPGRYLPAYGGYCAYGVSVGKKFVGDPDVWKIVDGRLYLNLDREIQKTWLGDVPGYIRKAERNWQAIRDADPASL